jgi:hypothetical protein
MTEQGIIDMGMTSIQLISHIQFVLQDTHYPLFANALPTEVKQDIHNKPVILNRLFPHLKEEVELAQAKTMTATNQAVVVLGKKSRERCESSKPAGNQMA